MTDDELELHMREDHKFGKNVDYMDPVDLRLGHVGDHEDELNFTHKHEAKKAQ